MHKKIRVVMALALMVVLVFSMNTKAFSAPNVTGNLLLYTSQPDGDAAKLVEAFHKAYPGVTVEVFRSGTEEVISKVYAEKEGGRILADMLLVADNVTFERLKQDKLLMPYQSPELANIDIAYIDSDFMFVGTKAISSVIAYNTNLVKTAPSDWADMVSSEAAGKVSMASPLYSGAAAYQLGILVRVPQLGWNYYERLKATNAKVGRGNGGVITDVVGGEKAYGLVIDFMANNAKKEGNPIDFVYPSSGSVVVTEPVGIMSSTRNADAAKLFLDFILSREGQELAGSMGYVPLHKDVKGPDGLKSIADIRQLTADVVTLDAAREDDKEKFSILFD